MTDTMISLDRKLNGIIREEISKPDNEMNCDLIKECTAGILRMKKTDGYIMSGDEYQNAVNEILPAKKQRPGKTAKILIAAAAIVVLTITTALAYAQIKYNIFSFGDHSTISTGKVFDEMDGSVQSGYIPSEFTLSDEQTDKYSSTVTYCRGDKNLIVYKTSVFENINVDTEYGETREKEIDGINYIFYGNDTDWAGVIWYADSFCYNVAGNITESELVKIAKSTR